MHYSLRRAVGWNFSGYLYLIIASFISTPILVNSLGFSSFTQYSLILATLAVLSSLNLGLPQAVTRSLSKDHEFSNRRQSIWASSSILFVCTGVMGGLISACIIYYLNIDLLTIPLVFAISVMNNLVGHYSTLPHAEGHFGYWNAKTFIVGTSNTLLAAWLAINGHGIVAILSIQLISYILTLLVLGYFSLKYFPYPRTGIPKISIMKSLIRFGVKNQIGTFVGQVQSQYGKYLLIGLSPVKLSAYIIATSLVQKIIAGVGQIATSFYPASSRGDNQLQLKNIYTKIQLHIFVFGILAVVGYQYVGQVFLIWWLKDFSIASEVHSFLLIYRFYALLLLLTPMASSVVDGRGRPGMTSLFGASAFILELIIAVVMLPRYGVLAPAFAGLISLSLMTPLFLIFTGRILSRVESGIRREHV